MSWSKVNNKHRKPLKWWYHKFMCEFWYEVRNAYGDQHYYDHLNACIRIGYNLYGEKF